jgi:D-alanyl-D-alanine dipeptidase
VRAARAAAIGILSWLCACGPGAEAAGPALVDIRSVDRTIQVALSYATARNVFHRRFYRRNVALLRLPVARRLARVQRRLRRLGLSLRIWDAYRPRNAQWTMWRIRPNARYLAPPWRGSRHSRGAAVDVTLARRDGRELPMPTPHDEFSLRAHRGARRGVSKAGRRNAALLLRVMRAEGFISNRYEWWHFDAPGWRRFPLLDVPVR